MQFVIEVKIECSPHDIASIEN